MLMEIARKLKPKSLATGFVVVTCLVITGALYLSVPKFRHKFSGFDASIFVNVTEALASGHPLGAKTVKGKPAIFIYLVQTEECSPQYLLEPEYFGSPDLCLCEVFVLSFKSPCWKNNHSHVHYSFEKTGWGHGRNRLYELAKKENYDQVLYYIFLDDDMHLQYNGYAPEEMKSRAPARVFEQFLLEHEPAIGVLDYGVHHGVNVMISKRKTLCGQSIPNENHLYITTIHFDGCYNAIHRNASDHLLPYPTNFEETCWWHSQKYLIVAAEIQFRGQVEMFKPLILTNPYHRGYPRNDGNRKEVYSYFVEEMVKKVPEQYRKTKFLRDLQANAIGKIEDSLSVCMDVPPKHPIEPFAHFTWNLTGIVP